MNQEAGGSSYQISTYAESDCRCKKNGTNIDMPRTALQSLIHNCATIVFDIKACTAD